MHYTTGFRKQVLGRTLTALVDVNTSGKSVTGGMRKSEIKSPFFMLAKYAV